MKNLEQFVGFEIIGFEYHINDTDYLLTIKTHIGNIVFYHEQDCCENVYFYHSDTPLEKIQGKIVSFYETTISGSTEYSMQTLTFYTIQTDIVRATLTFLGESNGYCSESVDIRFEQCDTF